MDAEKIDVEGIRKIFNETKDWENQGCDKLDAHFWKPRIELLLAELDRVGGELEQQKIINESLEAWKAAVEKEHEETHKELARMNAAARRMASELDTRGYCPISDGNSLKDIKCVDCIITQFLEATMEARK